MLPDGNLHLCPGLERRIVKVVVDFVLHLQWNLLATLQQMFAALGGIFVGIIDAAIDALNCGLVFFLRDDVEMFPDGRPFGGLDVSNVVLAEGASKFILHLLGHIWTLEGQVLATFGGVSRSVPRVAILASISWLSLAHDLIEMRPNRPLQAASVFRALRLGCRLANGLRHLVAFVVQVLATTGRSQAFVWIHLVTVVAFGILLATGVHQDGKVVPDC